MWEQVAALLPGEGVGGDSKVRSLTDSDPDPDPDPTGLEAGGWGGRRRLVWRRKAGRRQGGCGSGSCRAMAVMLPA